MPWPICFILAYVLLGLQVGISRYVVFHGAEPNLGLLAVLFITLNVRRESALLGSFGIGCVQDLLSAQQPGLFAFSYGLVAMVCVSAHRLVNREHPLTYFALALVSGLITALILLLHSLIHPAGPGINEGKIHAPPMRISAAAEFIRIGYTAALAPVIWMIVQRMRSRFRPRHGRGR